jgi:hypothetical protein
VVTVYDKGWYTIKGGRRGNRSGSLTFCRLVEDLGLSRIGGKLGCEIWSPELAEMLRFGYFCISRNSGGTVDAVGPTVIQSS